MTKISYSGYRFPPEIIHQAIWLYLRFTLSFRDVEDLLAERGIVISYETVRRWVNHFGPIIAVDAEGEVLDVLVQSKRNNLTSVTAASISAMHEGRRALEIMLDRTFSRMSASTRYQNFWLEQRLALQNRAPAIRTWAASVRVKVYLALHQPLRFRKS